MASRLVSAGQAILFAVLILTGSLAASGIPETRLTLQDALKLSLEHSPAVQSLYRDSLSSAYELAAARALRYPTLSCNLSSFYVDDIPGIRLPMEIMEIGTHDNYQADVRLSLPLFTAGRISHQVNMHRQLTRIKAAELEAERLKTAYETRGACLRLMLSQAALRTAESSQNRIRIINQDIVNLFTAGLADSVDLLDAELSAQRIGRQVDEHETALENASAALASLLGLNLEEPIVLEDSLPEPDFSSYENLESSPLTVQRPELKALESKRQAAEFAAGLARASSLPSLSGFAGYSYGKPNKDIFNKTWNDYWSVGLNLNWEWNLGGRSVKTTQAFREVVQSVQMAGVRLQESFTLQAQAALSNLARSYRSFESSHKELQLAMKQFRLASVKHKSGTLSTNRLLELEADLDAAEQRHQADIISFFLAEAEFLQAVGSAKLFGGF